MTDTDYYKRPDGEIGNYAVESWYDAYMENLRKANYIEYLRRLYLDKKEEWEVRWLHTRSVMND